MSFSHKTFSLQHRLSCKLNSSFDEKRWIVQLRHTLGEDLDNNDETEIPVCIFNVPKSLLAINNLHSYIPQEIAIGPYHHWRSELYEMERQKVSAAKRVQKQFQNQKFEDFVLELTKSEQRIRGFYHKYLDFNGETLAWMVAVDASFLIEFLQITASSTKLSHTHNPIFRDIVMLENQIPLFVLRQILELRFPAPAPPVNEILCSVLLGVYKELSPFGEDLSHGRVSVSDVVSECFHLLDFLYRMILPKFQELTEVEDDDNGDPVQNEAHDSVQDADLDFSQTLFKQLGYQIWRILSVLNSRPTRHVKRIILSKPLQVISKLPWKTLCNIPGIPSLRRTKTPATTDGDETDLESQKPTHPKSHHHHHHGPPLTEEITIPSVTDLTNSGVKFTPSRTGGISSISFDPKTASFVLPTLTLNPHTDVVLRNLVAYEASRVASGPLVLARFTELINGIIDSEEDVRLLRENGIIVSHLKSDGEVAELWNGMSRSLKLTKVGFLDKVIEDVNGFYRSRLKVRIGRFVKKTVFGSWPVLTLLAAVLLLLLTALQAFCSVYTCANVFHFDSN